MGRIKVFFCSLCFDRNADQATNDHSFSQSIDVSHLAAPHISPNDNNHHLYNQPNQPPIAANGAIQQSNPSESQDRRDIPNQDASNSSPAQQENIQARISPSLPNIYEPQSEPSQEQQQPIRPQNDQVAQNQQQVLACESPSQGTSGPAKLSYDIISVRVPLAEVLAQRQLQQAQMQQRQILGDHEYIEVYGERGSSCFYEEIAGSTTSSATYDQIGNPQNHNYQVLLNTYAVANRPNGSDSEENSVNVHQNSSNGTNSQVVDRHEENMYDVTHSNDQVDNATKNDVDITPSTSFNAHQQSKNELSSAQQHLLNDRGNIVVSQSIPVYSVINKATRRSNAIIRSTIDNPRPPKPPPKNLLNHQSSSAIQPYQELSIINTQMSSGSRSSPQVPSTSSYKTSNNNISECPEDTDHQVRLPKPPPRFSKHPMYSATNRPLPLPENYDNSTNNNSIVPCRNLEHEEDLESLNNGYELLNSNFDDDLIDVGYEKIRESNRYSGGSISSQFCPLQVLDNGGYESVQPIYSSPSNALAEPNYEAIGPATASELAAAATAKLTAAAAAIEQYFKKDQ